MTHRKAPRNPHGLFALEGACARPHAFSFLDLAEAHQDYQVADLTKLDRRLKGRAVRLRCLLDRVGPLWGTRYVTVESADGEFSACLPLAETARTALIVYEQGGQPIPWDAGGPVRFVVPFHPDPCSAVKSVGRIVLSVEPGRDTRPSTAAEHARLHADEGANEADRA